MVELRLDWYYNKDGTPVHKDCGGWIIFFKEGPICDKCEESREWDEEDK